MYRNRGFYLGIVGAVWAVASALGPVLGGIFAEKLNWRWCFFVNCKYQRSLLDLYIPIV